MLTVIACWMHAPAVAIEAKTDPFHPADFIIDDVDEEEFGDDIDYDVDIDGIEACLDALERGQSLDMASNQCHY